MVKAKPKKPPSRTAAEYDAARIRYRMVSELQDLLAADLNQRWAALTTKERDERLGDSQ